MTMSSLTANRGGLQHRRISDPIDVPNRRPSEEKKCREKAREDATLHILGRPPSATKVQRGFIVPESRFQSHRRHRSSASSGNTEQPTTRASEFGSRKAHHRHRSDTRSDKCSLQFKLEELNKSMPQSELTPRTGLPPRTSNQSPYTTAIRTPLPSTPESYQSSRASSSGSKSLLTPTPPPPKMHSFHTPKNNSDEEDDGAFEIEFGGVRRRRYFPW